MKTSLSIESVEQDLKIPENLQCEIMLLTAESKLLNAEDIGYPFEESYANNDSTYTGRTVDGRRNDSAPLQRDLLSSQTRVLRYF